jgi:hypothetical protein
MGATRMNIGDNYLPELAARIKAEHRAAGDALNRAVMHAMAAGDLLAESKGRVKLPGSA